MRVRRTVLQLAVMSAAAVASSAWAQSHKLRFDEALIPKFNIPRIAKPPKIDGRIGADEWRRAVKLMGVVRTGGKDFRDRPISFWVAWDAEHLYLAARSDVLPGHRLYRQKRERYTQGTVFDDAYEFGLFLHDRNKLRGQVSSYMKFIINSLGSGEYMKLYPSIGQNLFNWRPDMQIGNRVYKSGGRQWWDLELAADLEDLQMPRRHRAGDPVWLLLAADLKNPKWQWLDFPTASGHLQHTGFPRAVLTEDKPYVQIERLSGLHDGRLDLKSVIYNPSPEKVQVEARVRILHGFAGQAGGVGGRKSNPEDAETVLNVQKELAIAAGGSARMDVSRALPNLDYPKPDRKTKTRAKFSVYEYRLTLADKPDAPPVLFHNMSFVKMAKDYLKAVPRTTVFEAGRQFNPVRGLLAISGDTLDAQVPKGSEIAAMTYRITRGGKTLKAGRIERVVHFIFQELIELPDLAPGTYKVRLAMVDAAARELAVRDDLAFEKKDEAKAFAKWWNNKLARTDRVLKPFEPLKVHTEGACPFTRIACTRRLYYFTPLGLPAQILSNGGKVLSGPARIVVTVGGKEHASHPRLENLKVTRASDWRVDFEGKPLELGGLRFRTVGWMEQDGLVEIRLTFGPAGKPVAVQAMRIEWPIDETLGLYTACMGSGNYCPRYIGKVPAGEGRVWDTIRHIGLMGSGLTAGSFMGNLWVGTERRGLLWAADSDRGWVVRNDVPAHALHRAGKTLTVRNHVIAAPADRPFVLDRPRTIRFSYNASPFRKFIPGWRLSQIASADGFSHGKYKVNWDTGEHNFTVLSPPFRDVKRWPEYYAHCKVEAEKRSKRGLYSIGPRLTFYLNNQIALRGYAPKSMEPGVYDYFGGDWGGDTLSRTQRDYLIYLQDRLIREGGCTHFYYDISFTSKKFTNLAAGFGHRLPDGRIQPEGCDDNLRAWYKRAWAQMQDTGMYPGGVSGHATNSISLKALPFADAILDSEYPMKDPMNVYPSDRMIALSCPHNFGVNISHLGYMNPTWPAMHDAGMGGGQANLFWHAAFRHWGIARADVEFVPYWRNSGVVKDVTDGVLVSLWKRPGSAVLGVCNYGPGPEGREKTRAVRMTLDLAALGVPKAAREAGGEMVRAGQLMNQPAAERYVGHLKWYKDLPGDPGDAKRSANARRKTAPPIRPRLDPATGALDGFKLFYHDVRFLVIHWEDRPVRDDAWAALFPGKLHAEALDWGINSADTKAVHGRELASTVKIAGDAVRVQAWRRPHSVLLRLENTSDKPVRPVAGLDLRKLGVKVEPNQLWSRYTQCYDFQHVRFGPWSPGVREGCWPTVEQMLRQVAKAGAVAFDGWNDRLAFHLAPRQVRCVSIDTY